MVLGVVFASSRKLLRVVLYANFYLSYFDPLLDPVFFLRSFSCLHFHGYQDRFFMDFDQFFGLFLEVFFHKFPDCRQIMKMSLSRKNPDFRYIFGHFFRDGYRHIFL